MGIDNTAKLIFGIEIDYESLERIMKTFDKDDFDDFQCLFYDKYNVYFLRASPYYDSPLEDNTFFISMIDSEESLLSDLIKISEEKKEHYTNCLEKLGIEYKEPKLLAVPHIW